MRKLLTFIATCLVSLTMQAQTLVLHHVIYKTEKVSKKCPECGGDMKETGKVFLID